MTTSCASVVPGPATLTGRSQSAIAAASTTATMMARRSFSSAMRRDSLCLNVMVVAPPVHPLGIEELAHVRRRRGVTRERVDAQPLEDQAQRALVLVRRGRLVAPLGLRRADRHPVHLAAAQRVVTARF